MLDFFYGLVLLSEVIICIIIGIFIIRRDTSERLNQAFFMVMICFAGYLFFESVIYLLNIVDLPTADILRDMSVLSSTASSTLLVFTALIVQYGDEVFESRRNLLIGSLTVVILAFSGMQFDSAEIPTIGANYIIFINDIIGKIFLLLIPMIFLIYAMFRYMMVRQSSDEPVLRAKLLRLTIGLILILIGIGYFAIFPSFRYPGHISYIIGLIMLLWAFK
ncbi:MAG: hypothetical protein ACXADA_06830 [Candidatus Hodarchaeales archaeon]|jgi:hypothetical protein